MAVYGVDLLDFYRGHMTYRRVCVLVGGLPADARVWRAIAPEAGWSRLEMLTAAVERRMTALWAAVAAALGQTIPPEHLASPLELTDTDPDSARNEPEPETVSLRDMARMMRGT
ncbi:hypothetical protein BCF44_110222 [Kutzneria buriramensis]|uniref:Uncharacterized protein n=1 Tax=Kutzneria buriramensis TaxID=1045776 RepID=A0A3E0HD03_9PSEU|nr:hypothetical protein BCF44_110222 [Kutzneria buriramensis]